MLGFRVWSHEDYLPEIDETESEALRAIADRVRGERRAPVIFVHGVLPRSGTNLVANALALHPDVVPFPSELWEFPVLHAASGARALRDEIIAMFPANEGRIEKHALLAYLASAWIADLQAQHPNKLILLKSPHVRELSLFPSIFPRDRLVLCLRDGRDVAASSARTFKGGLLGKGGLFGKSFRQLAIEWSQATEAALDLSDQQQEGVALVRFEDMVEKPKDSVEQIWQELGLSSKGYPYDELARLPVFGSSTNEAVGDDRWTPVAVTKEFAPVGRWRNWPERRKEAFARIAGRTLCRAGYA